MSIPGLFAPGALAPLDEVRFAPAELRVIGLDLSLTSTGVALPDGTTYRIKTRDKDGDRRLLHIRDSIRDDLEEHEPHLAVIEDLPKHAMAAGITAQVHGVVKAELLDAAVPYALIVPATLKSYACDHGSADKARMAAAAYLAAGAEFADDRGGDQCDAWWLRAAGHDWCGMPLFTLPQAQRDRLGKAKWPDAYRQRYVMGVAQ
ncbi:crossover junction endodeoxyribonuclease RuvC [Streptomyces decoyicus]